MTARRFDDIESPQQQYERPYRLAQHDIDNPPVRLDRMAYGEDEGEPLTLAQNLFVIGVLVLMSSALFFAVWLWSRGGRVW